MKRTIAVFIVIFASIFSILSQFAYPGQGCYNDGDSCELACSVDCGYRCGRECCCTDQTCCYNGCFEIEGSCTDLDGVCTGGKAGTPDPDCLPPTTTLPPCDPACGECGFNDCGDECENTCGVFNSACTGNLCEYYPGFLSARIEPAPCINNTEGSRSFTVKGLSSYCGDITISFTGIDQSPVTIVQDTYGVYVFEREFTLPEASAVPKPAVTVKVQGNRESIDDSKDIYDYTEDCKIELPLNLYYLNFFYCPDYDDRGSIPSDFDHYTEKKYFNFSNLWYPIWDPGLACISDTDMLSCSYNPTDCVSKEEVLVSPGVIVYGAAWTSGGKAGGAYVLDGADDYLEIIDSPPLSFERTESFSVAAWYKGADSVGAIFSKMNTNNNFSGYDLYIHEGKLKSHLINTWPSNAIARKGSTPINNNAWHHLAMTYDGSSTHAGLKLYVDGIREIETDEGGGLTADIATSNLIKALIGARSKGSTQRDDFIAGIVDEVKVYDYELSSRSICRMAGRTWSSGVCI